MPKLTLYYCPGTCSRVTMTALAKLGLNYESEFIDLSKGEQKSAAYLAINPDGKVPALLADGQVLTQNAAILSYLHRLQGGLLPPTQTLMEDMQQLSDLFWVASTVHPMVRQVRAPMRFTTGDTKPVKADGQKKIAELLPMLQDKFNPWWYDECSIIDVYLHWCLSTAASAGVTFDDYSNIMAHIEKTQALPEYQEALRREALSNTPPPWEVKGSQVKDS